MLPSVTIKLKQELKKRGIEDLTELFIRSAVPLENNQDEVQFAFNLSTVYLESAFQVFLKST